MNVVASIACPSISGLLPREALNAAQRAEMCALLTRHFDGVTPEQFERDLAGKNWVIEIRRADRLLGFSTLLVSEEIFEGETFTVISSGDTIVAPEAWGSPALARTWISAVNHLRTAHPDRRCYWLLLTSGFRTYRFLPVFWREFFPCYRVPTSPPTRRLLDHLAQIRYGANYDRPAGLVRFPHPQRLAGSLGELPTGRTADPHIAFFLERNPGHGAGDELVCLTEIHERNLTAAGRRMIITR